MTMLTNSELGKALFVLRTKGEPLLHEMACRIADHLTALTALPEDVERDAARVPGLEARCAELMDERDANRQEMKAERERARTAESERDAARQEVERWKTRANTEQQRSIDEQLRREEAEARVTAAEKRIRAAQDRLTGILKSPDRKDPLELETCVDEVAALHARATSAETKMNDVEMLLNTNERTRAYHHLPLRERVAALLDAPTQAPGLREAQETIQRQILVINRADNEAEAAHLALDALGVPRHAGADEMPPGGELPLAERIQRTPPAPTPSVTHAALAAVVGDVDRLLLDVYADPAFGPDAKGDKPFAEAILRALLRRVTGGQVPEHPDTARLRETRAVLLSTVADITAGMTGATYQPSGETRLLAGLRALNGLSLGQVPEVLSKARVVEVLSDICAASDGRSDYAAGWGACVSNVRARLGLTLPTGPGGGEHVEADDGTCSLTCPACLADGSTPEEIASVSASSHAEEQPTPCSVEGCPRTGAHLLHVHVPGAHALAPDESRNPRVTPEGPALASKEVPTGTLVPVSPSFVKLTAPSTAYVKGDGCDVCDFQPAGKLHKWHCVYRDPCHYEDSEGREVHDAQPAAPEVLMEFSAVGYVTERLRVLKSGVLEYEAGPGIWVPSVNAAGKVLARALAEAKRDNEAAKTILTRAARQMEQDAARKAAEAMRERAARVADDDAETWDGGSRQLQSEDIADRIRSLPLEDK